MQSIISFEKVKELLPQKSPFVMVHKLLEHDEDSIITSLLIEEDNIFCHNGVFSESGLIEHLAQSVALHTGYDFFVKNEAAPVGYIGTINNLTINKLPKLGQTLQTNVKIVTEFMGVTLVEGEVTCEDEVVLSAKMKTFIAG